MMERFTLAPKGQEIVVNNGSAEGAVDLFSYGPEMEPAARTLGSLYVLGWRQADTNTMGYMVSLIAALARREYYAQPSQTPKDAFARTLRKINEVVDEFFKSAGVDLAVGIVAISGEAIMVSKLDKFKVLLARNGEVIDILNNIALFSKEHLEKRRFSSIISGSVHAGDRLLAYYPAKSVIARERMFKKWLMEEEAPEFAARLEQLGQEKRGFAASFVHIAMVQEVEQAQEAEPAPEGPAVNEEPAAAVGPTPTLAWQPRQQPPASVASAVETESEVPHLIPTEFSLGIRPNRMRGLVDRLRFIRLDGRGKAVILAAATLVIAGGVLAARSALVVSQQEQKLRQAIREIANDVRLAQDSAAQEPGEARVVFTRSLATLTGDPGLAADKEAKKLAAAIAVAMDDLDNAQTAEMSVLAPVDPKNDRILLATWSSASTTLWAVTTADDATSVVRLAGDGTATARTGLAEVKPGIIVGWRDGALVIDAATRTVHRVQDGVAVAHVIPTQETVLDAAVYADALYVLTDKSILKISDLDTRKPITKQWLTSQEQLAADAAAIRVDGNVYTLGRDGMLTTYYKGKKSASVKTPLEPSGSWRLVPTADPAQLAVASTDRQRVYEFAIADGALVRTLKLDSEQPLVLMAEGPDGSVLAVTKDNRIWKLR